MVNGLKKKYKTKNDRFSEGFVMVFLLFCIGSMTILGAFEEHLSKSGIFDIENEVDWLLFERKFILD